MSNNVITKEHRFIYCSRFLSTLSFSMFYSSLILYLNEYLKLDYSLATSITGVYFSVNFILPTVGGQLIDKYFSPRVLILLSSALLSLGSFFIFLDIPELLYTGLSLSMIGSGFSSISINCFINFKYNKNHQARDALFYYAYAFTNLGFLLGFATSGFFEKYQLHHYLFLLSCLTSFFRFILVILNWNILELINHKKPLKIQGIILLISLPVFGWICYQYASIAPTLLFIVAILAILIMWTYLLYSTKKQEHSKIWTFTLFYFGSLVYWMVYYTGPMGITMFIKDNVSRTIHGIEIAPQWLFNINALLTICLAPFLVYLTQKTRVKFIKNRIAKQFCLALFLLSISFSLFSLGIHFADHNGLSPILPTILHFIVQSVSEVLIAPIGLSLVARYIPKDFQDQMMGFWMMIYGISISCSSKISSLVQLNKSHSPLISNSSYLHIFNLMSLTTIIGCFTILVIISMFNTSDIIFRNET